MDEISKRPEAGAEEDPTAMAVDFALVISRMVNSVKDDPVQLRSAIYELARAKLAGQLVSSHSSERKRMRTALETAIRGVEDFSARKDAVLAAPRAEALAAPERTPALFSPADSGAEHWAIKASAPLHSLDEPDMTAAASSRRPRIPGMLLRAGILFAAVVAVLAVAFHPKIGNLSLASLPFLKSQTGNQAPKLSQAASVQADVAKSSQPAALAGAPASPLPTSFGVYAVADGKLFSLEPLPGRVPDRRVAISGIINAPVSTILPDGRASFIVFRREVAGSTPERVEVRVNARIVRAMTFEAGNPKVSNADESWAIRNIAFPYKVSPVKDNPDMYEIQPEDPDLTLAAGRYALVLKGVGYDFTVPGPVTDTSQCLEQTQAANGIFYSECKRP